MTAMTKLSKSHIVIGRLGKTHGVHGWLRLQSFTDPPENILSYANWQLKTKNGYQPLAIDDVKAHGEQLLIKLIDINSPEAAQTFVNQVIAIDKTQLPTLPEGEFYWIELEGLTVINHDGNELGVVQQIIDTGANTVLVIKGKEELWLPYIPSMIEKVALSEGKIYVRWEGYF